MLFVRVFVLFCFFKQKTAYEMRISDWSSDVCSSDLSRVFESLWHGRRHALVGPVQVDRWGQANIFCIGDFAKPKRQMLGLRGFPGNSINHTNSMFVPNHGPRVFVEQEVDVVCSVGYRKESWPRSEEHTSELQS